MEKLAEFAKRHVLEVTRQRTPMPRPAQCKLVSEISPVGLAASVGVAARDFLIEMNGEPASGLVDLEYYGPAAKNYIFYVRSRHERVTVRTTGIDPGIELTPTPDAIKATWKPADPDYSALLELWRARDYAGTAKLAEETLRATGTRATPALALLAAALVESGRADEGGALADEYLREHAQKWTMNFTAAAFHAKGVAHEARGERQVALGLWETAWDYEPLERTAQLIEKATGKRPPEAVAEWTDKPFPVDYRLPLLESPQPGQAALADALAATPAGALFLVCLLCSYRTNGPYTRFLYRWISWAPHFKGRLSGLHVITEETERPAGREAHFKAEDKARAAGLPMTLLFDRDGQLSGSIVPHGSPHILALDRQGRIVYHGDLDGLALWNALGKLEQ